MRRSSSSTIPSTAYSKALELTKNRFQGGAAPKSDVAQAQTQLDAARVLATDIKVQRAQYEHALAILIGKPPAAFRPAPDPPQSSSPPNCPPYPLLCRRSCWSGVPILQRPNAAWRRPTSRLESRRRPIIRHSIWRQWLALKALRY